MPKFDNESFDRAIRNSGNKDIGEFLGKYPDVGYSRLAEMLPDIPPIVIISKHLSHRKSTGQIDLGLREALYRSIIEAFPNGWPDCGREWPAIRPLTGWAAEMLVTCGLESYRSKIEAAPEIILNNVSAGWVPESPSDALIKLAIPAG